MSNTTKTIEGVRIYLSPLTPESSIGPYVDWMNDPDIKEYLESRSESYNSDDLRAYIENINACPDTFLFGIIHKVNGTHIGNIKLGPINRYHMTAEIGIIVGNRDYWNKGIATEAIRTLSDYAFNELNITKLNAGSYAANIGSVKAFLNAGFQQEGRLIAQLNLHGNRADGLLFGLLNPRKI